MGFFYINVFHWVLEYFNQVMQHVFNWSKSPCNSSSLGRSAFSKRSATRLAVLALFLVQFIRTSSKLKRKKTPPK